eukprot:6269680-Prymnesium_polylepis.2
MPDALAVHHSWSGYASTPESFAYCSQSTTGQPTICTFGTTRATRARSCTPDGGRSSSRTRRASTSLAAARR